MDNTNKTNEANSLVIDEIIDDFAEDELQDYDEDDNMVTEDENNTLMESEKVETSANLDDDIFSLESLRQSGEVVEGQDQDNTSEKSEQVEESEDEGCLNIDEEAEEDASEESQQEIIGKDRVYRDCSNNDS